MDLIHLFVSNLLLSILTTNEQDFSKRQIKIDRNFYDVDSYILWAEKKLNRMTHSHIEFLFANDTSLEMYYEIWNKVKHNGEFLLQVKEELEYIFPFLQRVKDPRGAIQKYLELLETIYDTIKEEDKFAIERREYVNYEDKDLEDECARETDKQNESSDECARETDKQNESSDECTRETDKQNESSDECARETDNAVKLIEEKESEKEANVSKEKEMSLDIDNIKNSKLTTEDVIKECKKLGIKIQSENLNDLLEQYHSNKIEADKLTLQGLKDYIRNRDPKISCSKLSRPKIVELFNSFRQ